MMERLTDDDIKKNKYTISQIKYSIINDNVSFRGLLKYQILTPYICAKYILFGGSDICHSKRQEDQTINETDILFWQQHITLEHLLNAQKYVHEEEKRELEEMVLMSHEDERLIYLIN